VRNRTSRRRASLVLFIASLLVLGSGCGVKAPPVSLDSIVPEAVRDLDASVREARVILQWSLPTENTDGTKLVDLVGFKVLRESFKGEECPGCPERLVPIAEIDLGSRESYIAVGGRIVWIDKGLQPGKTYGYRVVAFNKRGHLGQKSNRVEVLWGIPPPPPDQFRAAPGDGVVELEWAPVEKAVGYNIYRSGTGKEFPLRPVNRKLAEDMRYRDTEVVNEREYRYAVRSLSKEGKTLIEGENSTPITVVPVDLIPPSPPTGLMAFPLEDGVELGWIANPELDVVGYHVYRRRVGEPQFERLTDKPVREAVYLDRGVSRGEEYDYRITAIDGSRNNNESPFSELVRVRYTPIQ
jgi:fibronectin type 3 domain-containing protein